MLPALLVAIGGASGATARYSLDRFISSRSERDFPFGTFLVNASGALFLGLLAGLGLHHLLGVLPTALLATGFCGGYTTFSTFSYETVSLLASGSLFEAALNLYLSVTVGLLAAGAGIALGLLI
jgi:CrcB protein